MYDYLLQNGIHVDIAQRHATYDPLFENKTSSTKPEVQLITLSFEED